MRVLLSYSFSCLIGFQLLLFGCSQQELRDDERFALYISTPQGDSTSYRIEYGVAEQVDTLSGYYKLSPEYLKLGQQLHYYDSLALYYMLGAILSSKTGH